MILNLIVFAFRGLNYCDKCRVSVHLMLVVDDA